MPNTANRDADTSSHGRASSRARAPAGSPDRSNASASSGVVNAAPSRGMGEPLQSDDQPSNRRVLLAAQILAPQ